MRYSARFLFTSMVRLMLIQMIEMHNTLAIRFEMHKTHTHSA